MTFVKESSMVDSHGPEPSQYSGFGKLSEQNYSTIKNLMSNGLRIEFHFVVLVKFILVDCKPPYVINAYAVIAHFVCSGYKDFDG